jgi:hypothetical protein
MAVDAPPTGERTPAATTGDPLPNETAVTPVALTGGGVEPTTADPATIEQGQAISPAEVEPPALRTAAPETSADADSPFAEAIQTFVRDWAADWSRQDVEAYLARYADDFRPADGSSRTVWEQQRRQRLTGPGEISVEVGALEVEPLDGQHARVTFEQAYRASHYQDRVSKTLYLRLNGSGWQILGELSR